MKTLDCLALATIGFVALCGVSAGSGPDAPAERSIESSVVRVLVHASPPDLFSPWQKSGIESLSGSGVIIDGKRILTNAHVVEDAVSIEVKRSGTSKRYVAHVSYIGHDCDLALLEVEEDALFDNVTPIELGEMPDVQASVQAYGFPIGGEKLSITSGIVSRIEISTYIHSFEDLLLAQIDAAINPGNSGGPVVAGGSIVGIAVQGDEDAENTGYMVPVPIIRHFLEDVSDDRYHGFPNLGVDFQDLESDAHRTALGLSEDQTGALVNHVDHGGPANGALRPGDVLVAIDGVAVANDLTVERPGIGRVYLSEVFQSKQVGESLDLSVIRDGKPFEQKIVLKPHQFLVPGRRTEVEPQYLVFGGIVFQPVTIEYLRALEDLPYDLATHATIQNVVTEDRAQVIIIQKILPHPCNRGYEDYDNSVVETINGVVPRDMKHLAEIIDGAEGPWLSVVTEDRYVLTLNLEQLRAAQSTILASYGISRDRSRDLVLSGEITARAR